MKILFVCLANTCRSPLAAGILKKKLKERNMEAMVEVDSAGFEAYNINDHADVRAIQTGLNHEVDISHHRAKLFTSDDFDLFDQIYVMDSVAYRQALYFARSEEDKKKVEFLMNVIRPGKNEPIPDPFFRELDACEHTFDLLEEACGKIADDLARVRVQNT